MMEEGQRLLPSSPVPQKWRGEHLQHQSDAFLPWPVVYHETWEMANFTFSTLNYSVCSCELSGCSMIGKLKIPEMMVGRILNLASLETFFPLTVLVTGLPGGASGKESACQCRRCKRCRFDPWVRKIPWRKQWQPTLVFLPGKFHGQTSLLGGSPLGHKELDMAEVTALVHSYDILQVSQCFCASVFHV